MHLKTFCLLVAALGAASAEKVLFGQPSVPVSEARSVEQESPEKSGNAEGRKSRVFAFPSSQPDSRPRTTYVLASPSIASSHSYEAEDNSYDLPSRQSVQASSAALTDENRLLSLLPSLGNNGMQVGLDFKLPFFNVPYAKMFSGLAGPLMSGNGGFFGSSYGSLPSSTSSAISSLWNSENGLTSGLATASAMAVTAALLYPKITNIFSPVGGKGIFRDGSGKDDDFVQNLNSVLGQFNIDGESCLKVALCSVANARKRGKAPVQGRDATTTSAADIVDDLLNLPVVKKNLAKISLVQARDFGGTGGDCDYFNRENKCPIASKTFIKMLSTFG